MEWEERLLEAMSRFLRTSNERKRADIIFKMTEYQMISPYSGQEVDLQIMFGSHLAYNAFGILLRLPYLQIICDSMDKGG